MQENINRIYNPFKELDEYDLFRNVISQVKIYDMNIFNTWIATFSENRKFIYEDILKTFRVKINAESNINVNSVPRKLLKIRRTENQII